MPFLLQIFIITVRRLFIFLVCLSFYYLLILLFFLIFASKFMIFSHFYYILLFTFGEGNGHPLQYSCLKNSMADGPGRLQSMGLQRVRTVLYCLIVACVFSEHFKGLKL